MALFVAPDHAEPDDADNRERVDDGIDPGDVVRGDHHGEQPGGAERHQREPAPRARRARLGGMADVREPMEPTQVHDHAEGHADARRAEAPMPAVRRVEPPSAQHHPERFALCEPADHQRRGEGAQVDAHVEEREAGVASRIAVRVEPADERTDARLEEAGAERDQDEAGVERRDGVEREGVMTRGDDQPADQDRASRSDEVVRDIAPEDADHVAGHGVVAVDLGRELLVEPQAAHGQRGDHEQKQERPHAVVGEPFPHLGVEQHAQPAGVAADAPVIPLGMPGRGFGVWGQLMHRAVIGR